MFAPVLGSEAPAYRAAALFDAVLLADYRTEPGQSALQRAVPVDLAGARRDLETSWFSVPGGFSDLKANPAGNRRFRVAEHVGVAGADDPPAPATVAEQVGAALADPGQPVLPGQHAGQLQHLQRLGDGGAGALRLVGDGLVAREAARRCGLLWKPHSSACSTSRKALVIGPLCCPGWRFRPLQARA